MTQKDRVLSRLKGEDGDGIVYMPDLTLWYGWHQERDTLPDAWKGMSLPGIAEALGVPSWLVFEPWQVEAPGIEIEEEEQEGQRTRRTETSAGTLTARWTHGPDGSWWQTEYPVKTPDDLVAALEVVKARTYTFDPSGMDELQTEVGDGGVLAAAIPSRPYVDIVMEFLGWSEGLMILMDNPPAIPEMVEILEGKLQDLVPSVASLSTDVVFSHDNLDGQFLSPVAFDEHMKQSYARTMEVLSAKGKTLVVHAGGPVGRLLPGLAEAGVSAVEGVCGPPQGDGTLAQARETAGEAMGLWGGVSQELLLGVHGVDQLEAAVAQAVREAKGDPRMILGVADRVPVEAEIERLEAVRGMVEKASE
ncbi:MAG: uroporphyrinogen decarboxylase family protein [Candidatus Latescibacteria bacterium]|nr:uroporphyrinogen decarboxylase family protein [Candidatus Latescibacterota bacterium]